MSKIMVLLIGLLAIPSTIVLAQDGLGLSVNGQKVVPVGQLENFVYFPGDARIDARSFFGDIRCAALPGFSGTGLGFELDQVIKDPGVEPEAKYDISGAESISYSPGSGDISITFADGADPGCTHEIPAVGTITGTDGTSDPGSFWISDFGALFDVVYEVPESGDGFTIRVTNSNQIMPLRNISVRFSAPVSDSTTDFLAALGTVSSSGTENEWIWTIPLLWPNGATEDETTLEVVTTDVTTGVSVAEIESFSRKSVLESNPRRLVTVVNTSTSR
ncbi:MAG: hypothetical protein KGY53_03520 [Wenzhouxiangellaceae bacterium]|nr:hypothetical protein [Wenzhouxiangellaceae bacterium]